MQRALRRQYSMDLPSRLNAKMVSHLIAARQQLGMKRQIFFVGIGDYDTHGDQINRHPTLMNELNHALNSFYNATVELGVSDKVTTFSDFGRTLTSNGDGTDHGWGSHKWSWVMVSMAVKFLARCQSSLSGVTMTLVKAESFRQPRSTNMRLRLQVGTD